MQEDLLRTVSEKIDELVDEETNRKFGELNIVLEVAQPSEGFIFVKFRPLSPYSPIAVDTGRKIKHAVLSVNGVRKVRVECNGHLQDELVNRLINK